jgi:pimeloyl-ACP methyl ester carboxylesterase
MADDPAELRLEAVQWLNDQLKPRQLRLNRHLFLVPGITDETAGCWDWIDRWGREVIAGWGDASRTIITFEQLGAGGHSQATFVDFGDYVRRRIADWVGAPGQSGVAQFDVVCHSMGGLDTFAALVPLGQYDYGDVPLPRARCFITLDTPFRGVDNWKARCARGDISEQAWPGRPTQCQALRPGSPELTTLLQNRAALRGVVDHVVCMSASKELPIEVDWPSSDLWSEGDIDAEWGGAPTYHAQVVPGTCHSGVGGITWSPITIAQIFNFLLFTPAIG